MINEKKNILFAHIVGDPGGASKSLLYIIEGLDKQKYTPFLLFGREGSMIKEYRERKIESFVLRLGQFLNTTHAPFRFDFRSVLMTGYFILRFPIDVVLVYNIIRQNNISLVHINVSSLLSVAAGAKLAKVKVVWHIREIFEKNILSYFLARYILFCSNKVITISKYAVSMFPPSSKVLVVYNGIKLADAVPLKTRNEIRSFAGTNDQDIVCMMMGNLTPSAAAAKGFYDFIDAAAIVVRTHQNVKFWILGDSPTPGFLFSFKRFFLGLVGHKLFTERDLLEKKISDLQVGNHVKLVGYQKDVFSFLNASDITIVPHKKPEPFGRTLIESGAMRRVVISSAIDPTPEIISDDTMGVLVEPGNPLALSEAILRMIEKPYEREKMAEKFYSVVQEKFTTETVDHTLSSLYDRLLFH